MHHTDIQACHQQTGDASASLPIHTTLYDLIAAIDAEVDSDESDVINAVLMHMLKTYRISCLGDFEGRQMVLDEATTSYSAVA
jgi:hypothetical protein